MGATTTLPFDFIEYLCAERHITRSAAIELLATEVRGLARAEGAVPEPSTQGHASKAGPEGSR